jgi:hypothetical protein
MRRAAILPFALLLIGARGYQTHPWHVVLLPSADAAGQELTLAPDEVVSRSPAVQAPLATLQDPIELSIASIEQSLPAGTELQFVSVGGAAERLEPVPEAYCAIPRGADAGTAVRAAVEVMAFGLLRGLNRSAPFSTHCFLDRDGDGRFDTAFLSGARREADLEPLPVGPLAATIVRDRPIEGVREGRIVYAGPNRRGTRISFRFETADDAGEAVQREVRSTLATRDLPRTINIQGAEIEVQSYDHASRSVRLRLVRPMAPGGYGFTPPRQVTYIYVPG